jgi:hypothetical protein
MAYNVGAGDRDQAFLLPPDVREWLPAGHLAWFVLRAPSFCRDVGFIRG